MPLKVQLQLATEQKPYLEHNVLPGTSSYIEVMNQNRPMYLGLFCNPDDDGFIFYSYKADQLIYPEEGPPYIPKSDTRFLYSGAQDEHYRHPYIDDQNRPATIIAIHIGGLANTYAFRPN